jgi:periplasmic divalent cation tolerance protein
MVVYKKLLLCISSRLLFLCFILLLLFGVVFLSEFVMVYVSTSDRVEAERIARVLLDERLVACVNIVDSVFSLFHWEGKVESGKECLLVMKSRSDLFVVLEERVRALHSYDVPEIIAVPIVLGSMAYFDWMRSVLKR